MPQPMSAAAKTAAATAAPVRHAAQQQTVLEILVYGIFALNTLMI
jgi:hypothetical protein